MQNQEMPCKNKKNPFTEHGKRIAGKTQRLQYNQLLVIRKTSFPYQQAAGFLARRSLHAAAFPVCSSGISGRTFPAYSDEIAQASHLFPFYPFPAPGADGHRLFALFGYLRVIIAPFSALSTPSLPVDGLDFFTCSQACICLRTQVARMRTQPLLPCPQTNP